MSNSPLHFCHEGRGRLQENSRGFRRRLPVSPSGREQRIFLRNIPWYIKFFVGQKGGQYPGHLSGG